MSLVEIEIAVVAVLVVLLGAGIIEVLHQIRNAIQENYQASLARAMSTTDIAVVQEKEKIRKPCTCGHAQAVHFIITDSGVGPEDRGKGPCHALVETGIGEITCTCKEYKPKRGPWPGEVKC